MKDTGIVHQGRRALVVRRSREIRKMRSFFSAVGLCSFLLAFFAFVLVRSAEADRTVQTVQAVDVIDALLRIPAPPPPNPLVPRDVSRQRSPEFYSPTNPPDENAPIEDILDYWRNQSSSYNDLKYNPKPSPRALDRLITEVERDPSLATGFLNVLGDSERGAEAIRRIYHEKSAATDESEEPDEDLYALRYWLRNNTDEFSDELLKEAEGVAADGEYVTRNFENLLTLAKVDWNKAAPIVNRLYNDISQPPGKALATWALYKHALATDSFGDIERYRDELKAMVEDRNAGGGVRDLAMDALAKEKEFSGRDDWYLSLLGDETLTELRVNGQVYTGLTTLMMNQPPEKFRAKMLELVKSGDQTVRNAAVRNLTSQMSYPVSTFDEEVLRALIPWLHDPNWAKDINGGRAALVRGLASAKIPESVPGLIALLNEEAVPDEDDGDDKDTHEPNVAANVAVNALRSAANTISNVNGVAAPSGPTYPYRYLAITALKMQGSFQAVPALKRILPELDSYQRSSAVSAIFASGGYTTFEQANGIEAYVAARIGEARSNPNPNTANTYFSVYSLDETRYGNVEMILLGNSLQGLPVVSADVVGQTLERSASWQRRDPEIAAGIRDFINGWSGPAVNTVLLNDLKTGKASADIIVRLLSERKELREEHSAEIFAARAGGPVPAAITSCMLEQRGDQEAILNSGDVTAQTALLACGRLVRAVLPIETVAGLLSSGNKRLVNAAELYLESEDSAASRAILLARYPGQARIYGATVGFIPEDAVVNGDYTNALFNSVSGTPATFPYNLEELRKREEWLRQEVLRDEKILGVYSYDGNTVWIYEDKVMYNWGTDTARYSERPMTAAEFDTLRNFLAAYNVDELKPFISCGGYCPSDELVMIGRAGGRRVFDMTNGEHEFFRELGRFFESLQRVPGELRYAAGRRIPGLKVEFADDKFAAAAVWASGNDVRVMIEDKEGRERVSEQIQEDWKRMVEQAQNSNIEYSDMAVSYRDLIEQRRWDAVSWYSLTNEGLGGTAGEPDEIFLMRNKVIDSISPGEEAWKMRAGGVEVRVDFDNGGLYKVANGRAQKFMDGYTRATPSLTADGRWLFASLYDDEFGIELYRIDMANGRRTKVANEDVEMFVPIAYVPAQKKILLGTIIDGHHGMRSRTDDEDYYWIDPDTLTVTKASGTLAPLYEQTYRPLQKAEGTNQFWAAIFNEKKNLTEVGIYDAAKLSFTKKIELPEIGFTGMEMWANPSQNKVYFVYGGHLLSVPLPK